MRSEGRGPGLRPGLRLTLAFALIALAAPAGVEAQVLMGTVVDVADGRRVAAVEILLLERGDTVGSALTDAQGLFRMRAPYPGRFSLRASTLGYDPVLAEELELTPGQQIEVEIRLGSRPVELAPLEVVARRDRGQGLFSDYYYRLDQNRKTGRGIVLDRDDLEELEGLPVKEVLGRQARVRSFRDGNNVLGVSSRRGTGYCNPTFLLNGMPADEGILKMGVRDLEGLEIYREGESFELQGCVVAAWTRRAYPPRPPETRSRFWGRFGMAAGFVVAVLLVSS